MTPAVVVIGFLDLGRHTGLLFGLQIAVYEGHRPVEPKLAPLWIAKGRQLQPRRWRGGRPGR